MYFNFDYEENKFYSNQNLNIIKVANGTVHNFKETEFTENTLKTYIKKYAVSDNIKEIVILKCGDGPTFSMDFLKKISPTVKRIEIPILTGLSESILNQISSISVFSLTTEELNYLASFDNIVSIQCWGLYGYEEETEIKFKHFEFHNYKFESFKVIDETDVPELYFQKLSDFYELEDLRQQFDEDGKFIYRRKHSNMNPLFGNMIVSDFKIILNYYKTNYPEYTIDDIINQLTN